MSGDKYFNAIKADNDIYAIATRLIESDTDNLYITRGGPSIKAGAISLLAAIMGYLYHKGAPGEKSMINVWNKLVDLRCEDSMNEGEPTLDAMFRKYRDEDPGATPPEWYSVYYSASEDNKARHDIISGVMDALESKY